MTASAYLRIYLPVDALLDGGLNLPETVVETTTPLAATAEVGLIRGSLRDDILMAEYRGKRYGCPRRPLLRAMEGLLAFRSAYAGIGGELLVPEQVAHRAAEQLETIYSQPLARSYILTSAWHVPLRWFAAFDPADRELIEANGRRSIRYRTPLGEAAGRLAEAIGVLRESRMGEGVLSEVQELSDWIGEHPTEALVELDYGSVSGLFEEGDLLLDESSSDVWESINALAANDWETATSHYMSVAMRWAGPMAVAFSS